MSAEKIKSYTSDLTAFTKHFRNAIRTQKNSDKLSNTKALDLIHNIDLALTEQINTFENFETTDESSTLEKIKTKTAAFFGNIAGTIDAIREDPVSKILRDNYTALSMLASGYTMLYTSAIAHELDELAEFCQNSLTRTAQLVTETSQVLPFVVAEELLDNSEKAQEIGEQAKKETQKSWEPENMFESI